MRREEHFLNQVIHFRRPGSKAHDKTRDERSVPLVQLACIQSLAAHSSDPCLAYMSAAPESLMEISKSMSGQRGNRAESLTSLRIRETAPAVEIRSRHCTNSASPSTTRSIRSSDQVLAFSPKGATSVRMTRFLVLVCCSNSWTFSLSSFA